MVLDPIPSMPEEPSGMELVTADESTYEEWIAIAAEVFLPADVARAVFPSALLLGPAFRTVLARIDGEYVGAASVVHTGGVAGIYSVGTLEHARRRGVGRATTAAVITAAATDWGVKRVYLQSSAMGFPVYEALGFRTVSAYHMLAGGLRSATAEV
jgi:GNAT superfamily N-acetyltransferase